ncbi:hypothetical protein DSLASN_14900 [Desulfoluna limicola]|uniref:Biopolymer transporter ExbD n=1 Tax=Desulfoluna limicola TaxID=2810562 RepID=A0ABM7PFL9_9BACT|nr:hypothetical protein [Desulfoluna limicola]BCS95858.1 hypothetical protein DSLASN_14900 [Desulfoluna limicola]
MRYEDSKIWLFSFADLAFLLLIAFTQASTIGKQPVHIGEMTIPQVVDAPSISTLDQPRISFQIRVLKPTIPETTPFQLVTVTEGLVEPDEITLDTQGLRNRLTQMKQEGKSRPMLVPDRFSLSKDTLMAMAMIEKVYDDHDKRVTVQKVADKP